MADRRLTRMLGRAGLLTSLLLGLLTVALSGCDDGDPIGDPTPMQSGTLDMGGEPEPEPEPTAQPEPEPAAEPEPSVQPEPSAQPEPEPSPQPEPAAQPEPEPDAQPEPMPEPEPAPAPAPGARPPFPDLPAYSGGACPVLGGGPDSASSVVANFPSGDAMRTFRLMVPAHYDGSEPLPLVFGWHWLNASSNSFVREAEMESAVEQMNFIAVLPDAVRNDNGDRTFLLTWPFAEVWGYDAEMLFFDDMLACVTEEFNVDTDRIYGIGVSAGGLWLTTLATSTRSDYFAAIEVLSGGLGDMLGVWRMEYMPQANKFPAMVLWGGLNDWLALSFHDASIRLRDELRADDHFVVQCTHDTGHGVPPVDPPPDGDTKFRFLWTFMFDHPYTEASSPYLEDGLPDVFPDWCSIPE